MLHDAQLRARRVCGPLKEVVGSRYPQKPLRFGSPCKDAFHDLAGAILIVVAADKELGLHTSRQKSVGIVPAFRVDWNAEANQALYPDVSTAGTQTDVRTEGEARKQDRPLEVVLQPTERGADVVLLALPVIERTFAQPDAAEVEPQHGQTEGRERLHRVVDDLIVHGATASGMRVADQRGVGSVVATGVQ